MAKIKKQPRPKAQTPKGFQDYFGADVTARNDMLRDTGDEIPGLSRHAIRLVAGRSEDQRRKVRFDPNIDIYWGVSTSETLGSPSVILRVMRAPRRLAGFCCGNPE